MLRSPEQPQPQLNFSWDLARLDFRLPNMGYASCSGSALAACTVFRCWFGDGGSILGPSAAEWDAGSAAVVWSAGSCCAIRLEAASRRCVYSAGAASDGGAAPGPGLPGAPPQGRSAAGQPPGEWNAPAAGTSSADADGAAACTRRRAIVSPLGTSPICRQRDLAVQHTDSKI